MQDVKSIIYERNNHSFIINISNESTIQYRNNLRKINNDLVFKYFLSLYRIINEWDKEYINTSIIDGDVWKLSINYLNGNKKKYYGRASYPYNFEAFERLNQELINEVENGKIEY